MKRTARFHLSREKESDGGINHTVCVSGRIKPVYVNQSLFVKFETEGQQPSNDDEVGQSEGRSYLKTG